MMVTINTKSTLAALLAATAAVSISAPALADEAPAAPDPRGQGVVQDGTYSEYVAPISVGGFDRGEMLWREWWFTYRKDANRYVVGQVLLRLDPPKQGAANFGTFDVNLIHQNQGCELTHASPDNGDGMRMGGGSRPVGGDLLMDRNGKPLKSQPKFSQWSVDELETGATFAEWDVEKDSAADKGNEGTGDFLFVAEWKCPNPVTVATQSHGAIRSTGQRITVDPKGKMNGSNVGKTAGFDQDENGSWYKRPDHEVSEHADGNGNGGYMLASLEGLQEVRNTLQPPASTTGVGGNGYVPPRRDPPLQAEVEFIMRQADKGYGGHRGGGYGYIPGGGKGHYGRGYGHPGGYQQPAGGDRVVVTTDTMQPIDDKAQLGEPSNPGGGQARLGTGPDTVATCGYGCVDTRPVPVFGPGTATTFGSGIPLDPPTGGGGVIVQPPTTGGSASQQPPVTRSSPPAVVLQGPGQRGTYEVFEPVRGLHGPTTGSAGTGGS